MLSYSKRGQVNTMELLMVMVVIGIIIAIGIYFYYTAFIKEAGEKGRELSLQEQEVLLGVIGKLPEVQCSTDTRTENCMDTSKLVNARDVIKNNMGYYSVMFGFKTVRVELVYPSKNNIECDENKYPDCGIFNIYENKKPKTEGDKFVISALISLYYPHDKTYKVGNLVLEAYR